MKKEEYLEMYKAYEKVEKMPMNELENLIQSSMNVELSEIVSIPYKGKINQTVNYNYKELVARCPMTKILDTYEVDINFVPDKHIPELKSLKFYFLDYMDIPISHEHLEAKLFKDFKNAIKPKKLKINLSVAVRGGIKTDITYQEE